jgi:GNAT superfamily N-acetyltransferase
MHNDPSHVTAERDGFTISTDRARLDVRAIHAYLTRSYWAEGIPEELVRRSIDGALCFGIYAPDGAQVGFARVISDYVTFAYLADVFVLEPFRGRGLSIWLMEVIVTHPSLREIRRFALATRDAHGIYARFGFNPLADPSRHMEIVRQELYLRAEQRPAEPIATDGNQM